MKAPRESSAGAAWLPLLLPLALGACGDVGAQVAATANEGQPSGSGGRPASGGGAHGVGTAGGGASGFAGALADDLLLPIDLPSRTVAGLATTATHVVTQPDGGSWVASSVRSAPPMASVVALGAGQEARWRRDFVLAEDDVAFRITAAQRPPGGGLIIVGTASRGSSSCVRLLRLDEDGTAQWARHIGCRASSRHRSGPLLLDGDRVALAVTEPDSAQEGSAAEATAIHRVRLDGTPDASASYRPTTMSPTAVFQPRAMQRRADGSLLVGGQHSEDTDGGLFLFEVDAAGRPGAYQRYVPSDEVVSHQAFAFAPDGDLLVAGATNANPSLLTTAHPHHFTLIRLAAGGTVSWARRYRAPGALAQLLFGELTNANLAMSLAVLQSGDVVVATSVLGSEDVTSVPKGYAFAVDVEGTPLWGKTVNEPSRSTFGPVAELGNGLLVVGTSRWEGLSPQEDGLLVIPRIRDSCVLASAPLGALAPLSLEPQSLSLAERSSGTVQAAELPTSTAHALTPRSVCP